MKSALTQREFAARLRTVMDQVLQLQGKGAATARKAGVAPNTLSRWRNAGYRSGPPRQMDLRQLEPVLGLPYGALLSEEDEWQEHLKILKTRLAARSEVGMGSIEGRVDDADNKLLSEILERPYQFVQRLEKQLADGMPLDGAMGWLDLVESVGRRHGYKLDTFINVCRARARAYNQGASATDMPTSSSEDLTARRQPS